uniref:ubiquitinyl hydrolase 1 n=1 Tax=Clastoptera arizonana TaxID=38151 RepID=A0A1B6DP74_9HEMI
MDNLIQFLDFTDLNPNEVDQIHNVLYSNTDVCVELPWENINTSQWVDSVPSAAYNAQAVINGGTEGMLAVGDGEEGEFSENPLLPADSTSVPTVYQVVQQPNVFVSNVTANLSVHSFVPQPFFPPDTRPNNRRQRPTNKAMQKRNINTVTRGIENPQTPNFQAPFTQTQFPQGLTPFPPQIPYFPPLTIHSSQPRQLFFYHNHPVFIPTNSVIYPPAPIPAPNSEPMPAPDEEPIVHVKVEEPDSEQIDYHQQTSEEEEIISPPVVESVVVENSTLVQKNIPEEPIPVTDVVEDTKTEKVITKLPPATAFKSTPTPPQKPPFPAIGQRNPPLSEDNTAESTFSMPTPSAPKKSFASLFSSSSPAPDLSLIKPLARVNPLQNSNSIMPQSTAINFPVLAEKQPSKPPVQDFSSPAPQRATERPVNHNPKTPSQLPVPTLSDDPNLHRLGEFLCNYQLDHRALSLQPRGLTNRSNYCYINAILQALVACPPFYNLMKALGAQCSPKNGKSYTPIIDSMVQFINEFEPMPVGARPPGRREKAQARKDDANAQALNDIITGPAFEPSYVYKMLNSIRNDTTFQVEGRQEDAEEFLSCLLNGLNDEMLELVKLAEPVSLINGDITVNGDTSYTDQNGDWTEVVNKSNRITRRAEFGKTPMSAIFRGHLRSRVIRSGNDSTDNVQPFFTLQLDIEKASSVKEALEHLVGKEPLAGLTCSKTNQEVEAWQQVSLDELPLVLLLHLKCFDYKLQTCSKIIKSVDFSIDLKLEQKVLSSKSKVKNTTIPAGGKDRQYKLFAVVYHDGKEATKGHYITDVFHVGYSRWVRYDDATVRPVTEQQVLHPKGHRVPYLLYYRRSDTIWNPHDKSR